MTRTLSPAERPLALLLGPDAADLVAAALAGVGGRLRHLRATAAHVRPSGASVVQYVADVALPDGRAARELLAATTGARIPPGAALLAGRAGGAEVQVGLWRWPDDPALPALRVAADPAGLAPFLHAAGLGDDGPVRVRMRAYRPGRRAVLEATAGGRRLFCKVVRPGAVAGLRARHDLLAAHVPVPPVLAASPDGLLVLPELPGTPLRALLDGPGPRPDGPALEALLDRLPPALADLPQPRRPGDHLARVAHFADVLRLTAGPDLHGAVDALAARLADTDPGRHPDVAVHGDFYEAQLLVEDGAVTGLLDVDTAGHGHRIDEWATLLAHLSVLGRTGADRYGAALLAHAERRFARRELRPRIAAAVLALATGPFRVQQADWPARTAQRLDLARRWLGT